MRREIERDRDRPDQHCIFVVVWFGFVGGGGGGGG